MRIYNIVGTDGAWFSPYGWRARAVLLCKQIPVEWVDVPISELKSATAFAGTATTPLLVDDNDGKEVLLKDSWSIARYLDEQFPTCPLFPKESMPGIELFNRLIDPMLQIPGFAAFSNEYFSNKIVYGTDAVIMRNIVERATGRSVEDNAAIQSKLVTEFRTRLAPLDAQFAEHPWLLRDFSFADVLLLSSLKCFATVLHGIDEVLGNEHEFADLRDWYARIHTHCHIEDPY